MADNLTFVGLKTDEQIAQMQKDQQLATVANDPSLTPIDPYEAIADSWVGPAPKNISAVDGYEEYVKLVEANKKGDRGFFEEAFDFEVGEVPFVGGFAEAPRLLRVASTARKMNKGEIPTDEELLEFNTYMQFSKRKENASLMAKVADVWQQSLSFMVEIGVGIMTAGALAGGATATAGKKSAQIGLRKLIAETAEVQAKRAAARGVKAWAKKQSRKVAGGLTKKALGSAGNIAGRFGDDVAVNAIRTAEKGAAQKASRLAARASDAVIDSYATGSGMFNSANRVARDATLNLVSKHMSPKAANVLAKGVGLGVELESRAIALQLLNPDNTVAAFARQKVDDAIGNKDQTELTMMAKAFMDVNIEYATEFAGEAMGIVAKKAFSKSLPTIKGMVGSTVYNFVTQTYDAVSPKMVQGVLREFGIGNILEEMSEERAGGFLRGLLGVNDTPGLVNAVKGALGTPEQLTTEAIAFSVLPVGMYMVNRATGGASAGERQKFSEAIKNFREQDDVVAVSQQDNMEAASQLVDAIDEERQPWFKDIQFMTKMFGNEKRGSLRGGLASVANVLEQKGINILKILDKSGNAGPRGREERVEAMANVMALMSNTVWKDLKPSEVEMLNGGVKDSSVLKKKFGMHRAILLTEEFLSKEGGKELAAKTGLTTEVDLESEADLDFGEINKDQFKGGWDSLEENIRNQFMARWGTQKEAWAKSKYETLQKLMNTEWAQRFDIRESLPAIRTGTKDQWAARGVAVEDIERAWDKNEKGENVYARAIFGWNDGKTISIAPSSDASDIAEETIEGSYKQRYGQELPVDAELYLDQLLINLMNERESTTPQAGLDFLPEDAVQRQATTEKLVEMLKTPNGRREVWAKALTMNRLGHSGQTGRYGKANELFGSIPFNEEFDNEMIETVGADVLNALNFSQNAFRTADLTGRGMEVRDALRSRRRGAAVASRAAIGEAIDRIREEQVADAVLTQLQAALDVANSDLRKQGNREDLIQKLEDLGREGVTFSSEAKNDLDAIGINLEELMNENRDNAWTVNLVKYLEGFDAEKLKGVIAGLYAPEVAERINDLIDSSIEAAAEREAQRIERLEKRGIEQEPEAQPDLVEGREVDTGPTKEKRVFGKTATPGTAFDSTTVRESPSVQSETDKFEAPEPLEAFSNVTDIEDIVNPDISILPRWMLFAPKALATWFSMEDLFDRDNLEFVAAIAKMELDNISYLNRPQSTFEIVERLKGVEWAANKSLADSGFGQLTQTSAGKVVTAQPSTGGRELITRHDDLTTVLDNFASTDDLLGVSDLLATEGLSGSEANRLFEGLGPRDVQQMAPLDSSAPLIDQVERIFTAGTTAAMDLANPITGLPGLLKRRDIFQIEQDEGRNPVSTGSIFTVAMTPAQYQKNLFGSFTKTQPKGDMPAKPVKISEPMLSWRRNPDHIKKTTGMMFNRADQYNVEGVIVVLDPVTDRSLGHPAARAIYAGQTGDAVDLPIGVTWKKNKAGRYFLDAFGNPAIEIDDRDVLARIELQPQIRSDFDKGAKNVATFVISSERLRQITGDKSTKLAGEIRTWMLRNRIRRLGIMEFDETSPDFEKFSRPSYHGAFQNTIATALKMKSQEDATMITADQELALEFDEKFKRARRIKRQGLPVDMYEEMLKESEQGILVTLGEVSDRDPAIDDQNWVVPTFDIEGEKTSAFDGPAFAAGLKDLNEYALENESIFFYVALNGDVMEKAGIERNDLLSFFAREDIAPNLLFRQKDADIIAEEVAPLLVDQADRAAEIQEATSALAQGPFEAGDVAKRVPSEETDVPDEYEGAEFPAFLNDTETPDPVNSEMENDLRALEEAAANRKDARVHLSVSPAYVMSVTPENSVDVGTKASGMHFGPPSELIQRAYAGVPRLEDGKKLSDEQTDPFYAARITAQNYASWLRGTEFQGLQSERRKWILDQIPKLKGKRLVALDSGNFIEAHAHVLANMANSIYKVKPKVTTSIIRENQLPELKLKKIISGGQTGADRAGLEIGQTLGLETGGTAPQGFQTEKGNDESLKDFGLSEVTQEVTDAYRGRNKQWGPRTEQNVIDSDGTVFFGRSSPGEVLTRRHASEHGKPYIANPSPESLHFWLRSNDIETLNVAGNRAGSNRGIASQTRSTLRQAVRFTEINDVTYSSGIVQYELGISPVGNWKVREAVGLTSIEKLKSLSGYDKAKNDGDMTAARTVAGALIKTDEALSQTVQQGDVLVPVFKAANIKNMIPLAMAERIADLTEGTVDMSIVQTNKQSHLGSSAMARLLSKAMYAGPVISGGRYVIVDDVLTSGSTVSGLRDFIESHNGKVVGVIAAAGSFTPQLGNSLQIAPDQATLDKINSKMPEQELKEILNDYGIAESTDQLTSSQAKYIATFSGIPSFRNRLNNTVEKLEASIPDTEVEVNETIESTFSAAMPSSRGINQGFDVVTPLLWKAAMADAEYKPGFTDEDIAVITMVEDLKDRYRNFPEATIEELRLDSRFDAAMRDEAANKLSNELANFRESEMIRELGFSVGMATDFMEYADVWMSGGAQGLRAGFVEWNRIMKAAQHSTGIWAGDLRRRVGIDLNRKGLSRADKKILTEKAREMLRAVKHRIDNPSAKIVITGREEAGRNSDGRMRWRGTTTLPAIVDIIEDYDALATKYGLLSAAEAEAEVRVRIENERQSVNSAIQDMTEKEWLDYLENYMQHTYQKRDDGSEPDFLSTVGRDARQAQHRVFPTFGDAIKYGFVPTTEDAVSNVETWSKTVWKKARDKFVLNAASIMTATDGAPVMIPVFISELESTLFDNNAMKQLTENFVDWAKAEMDLDLNVDPKADPKKELIRIMSEAPKLDKHGYAFVPVDNLSGVSGVFVIEGNSENVVRYIDSARWNNRAVNIIESLNHWMKFLALSLSLFHPTALMESFIAAHGLTGANPVFHPIKTYQAYRATVRRLKSDPEFSAYWINHGLSINATSPDIDKGGKINEQVNTWIEKMNVLSDPENKNQVLRAAGENGEKGLRAFLAMKAKWDNTLWGEFQPSLKIMIAEQAKLRQEAKLNRSLYNDEVSDIAQYANLALGGIEFERMAWTNPKVMQALHLGLFAPDWTMAAAGIAGFGPIFGVKNTEIQKDEQLLRYWPAMVAIVLYGIPAAIQGSMYLALGDPEAGDEPFPWLNGPDREHHIDVSPLARHLPGYEGAPTGKRRVYLRFGKQAYEVFEGWMGKPFITLMNKSSQVARSVMEQATGESPSGWRLGFKDKGLIGLVKGEGGFWDSRIGVQLSHFAPMSIASLAKGQPTTVFAPTSRGLSQSAMIKNIMRKLDAFARKSNQSEIQKFGLDLESLVNEDLHGARVNGYNEKKIMSRAVSGLRSRYYQEFYYALNKGKQGDLEEIADRIQRLGAEEKNILRSLRSRFSTANKKLGPAELESVRSAFNPV